VDFVISTFSYSTNTLPGGQNYSFRVIAFNDAGRGLPSAGLLLTIVEVEAKYNHCFQITVDVPSQNYT
jgi:hypothetical protein